MLYKGAVRSIGGNGGFGNGEEREERKRRQREKEGTAPFFLGEREQSSAPIMTKPLEVGNRTRRRRRRWRRSSSAAVDEARQDETWLGGGEGREWHF